MVHRTAAPDALEQLRAVNLAVVNKRMRIPVSGHDFRTLPDALADLRPRLPLTME
jgi:hypothetical protein